MFDFLIWLFGKIIDVLISVAFTIMVIFSTWIIFKENSKRMALTWTAAALVLAIFGYFLDLKGLDAISLVIPLIVSIVFWLLRNNSQV